MINQWLTERVVGDKVALKSGSYGDWKILTVTHLTSRKIIIRCGERFEYRFRKKDGARIGGDPWSWVSVQAVTDEVLQEIAITNARRYLKEHPWRTFKDADVIACADFVRQIETRCASGESAAPHA